MWYICVVFLDETEIWLNCGPVSDMESKWLLCVQSLSGHTTTIEAVRFGHAEEMVVAGSQSGALKVWDLEQAKSKS